MHISIDDVKGVFNALSKESMNSIFDTRTLRFLKDMHIKYGTTFDLYCTYSKEGYSLADISDKYQKEFKDNADWLRFGFHCYSENEDRGKQQFIIDIDLFLKDLKRITGQTKMSQYLRIHRFLGDFEYCKTLKEKGVSHLLTADDERNSYYLGKTETEILEKNGYWSDKETGIKFIKSAFRLENVDNVYEKIRECSSKNYPVIAVFTHEWLMDSIEIRNKMEVCCKYSNQF